MLEGWGVWKLGEKLSDRIDMIDMIFIRFPDEIV